MLVNWILGEWLWEIELEGSLEMVLSKEDLIIVILDNVR